jgi:hypothetical protein
MKSAKETVMICALVLTLLLAVNVQTAEGSPGINVDIKVNAGEKDFR